MGFTNLMIVLRTSRFQRLCLVFIPPKWCEFVVRSTEQGDGGGNGGAVRLSLAQEEGNTTQPLCGCVRDERVIRIGYRVERQYVAPAVVGPGFHPVGEETEPFLGHDLFEFHDRVADDPGDG